ncbi:MAG: hypothetical protein IKD43_02465 [Clostridia bacterium]|nr:hypothetical protein [Clostridia bacterium]
MKLKKIAGAALLLAPCLFLAACASTAKLPITANWYANTGNANLTGTAEKLVYDVSFEAEEADGFSAEYAGTYTTELVAENITYAEGNPLGYRYRTELSLTGRFTVNGTAGAEFTDTVISEVYFLAAASDLRPIRSEREVRYNAPNPEATTANEASVLSRFRYKVSYNADLTRAEYSFDNLQTATDDADMPTTYRISKDATFLDDAQIFFALRGLDYSRAYTFNTFNPVMQKVASVTSTAPSPLPEYKATFSMKVGENEATVAERTMSAVSLSIAYDGDRSGRSQELTYAACVNSGANTYRNVLLSAKSVPYNALGTFRLTLKEAIFNNK